MMIAFDALAPNAVKRHLNSRLAAAFPDLTFGLATCRNLSGKCCDHFYTCSHCNSYAKDPDVYCPQFEIGKNEVNIKMGGKRTFVKSNRTCFAT